MPESIICIHQMGKVGSTSIVAALEEHMQGARVYQTHTLSESGIANGISWWLQHPKAPRLNPPHHLLRSVELSRRLEKGPDACRWYLLTIVRDPLRRNISAFFQNLWTQWAFHLGPEDEKDCRDLLQGRVSEMPGERLDALALALIRIYREKYPHAIYEGWFDQEIRGVFGVDIFQHPFDPSRGFGVIRKGSVSLLSMRLEDLSSHFDEAARVWLKDSIFAERLASAPPLKIDRKNDSETKGYLAIYRRFLQQIDFAGDPGISQYSSRSARYFYSENELARFQSKWHSHHD